VWTEGPEAELSVIGRARLTDLGLGHVPGYVGSDFLVNHVVGALGVAWAPRKRRLSDCRMPGADKEHILDRPYGSFPFGGRQIRRMTAFPGHQAVTIAGTFGRRVPH